MRANVPRNNARPPVAELEGPYLNAMQEISVRLMETLPAGDDLWRTLGQVEALLLEAQLQERSLKEIFGNGGVAAFCQSIVDEFKQSGEPTAVPAARDKSVGREHKRNKEPRAGGVNHKRKRIFTVATAAIACLLILSLALWHVGLFNYWFTGSSFYLKELHNFSETVTPVADQSVKVSFPLAKASNLCTTLYTDGVYSLTLQDVSFNEYMKAVKDEETGKTVQQRTRSWYMNVVYNVYADFSRVSYVEPSAMGTVIITLPDGTVYTGELSWLSSGVYAEGTEFVRMIVLEFPADVDTTGATVEVDMGIPNLIVLDRISTGSR